MEKMEILETIKAMAMGNNNDLLEFQIQEIVEYADKEIEALKARAEKTEKVKAEKAKERSDLRNKIVDILTNSTEPMRAGEIASKLGVSPQKATYILRGLKEEGLVIPTVEKRTTVYTIA